MMLGGAFSWNKLILEKHLCLDTKCTDVASALVFSQQRNQYCSKNGCLITGTNTVFAVTSNQIKHNNQWEKGTIYASLVDAGKKNTDYCLLKRGLQNHSH